MQSLGDILREKGHIVYVAAPRSTVLEAVRTMAAEHVGAVLVCDGDTPVGILSERDVMLRVILQRRDAARTAVKDVMTRDLVCVDPDTPGEQAMAIMTEKRCRHLPVVHDGRLEGMISIGDLVRVASRDQEFEVRMLVDYVSTGTVPPMPPIPAWR
jgi:CBS domain-containing protein